MAFPWNDPLPTDSVGQKLPQQQQAARISSFNAAASIEDAVKRRFMEDFEKEQQYKEERRRFLQFKKEQEQAEQQANINQQQLPPGVEVDWAGFVVPVDRRKVYNDHASQRQTLKQENGYIVPQEENLSTASASSSNSSIHFSTSSRSSKKHFKNDQSFQTWDKSGRENPHRSATYQQGPGTNHGTSHWQTSTQSLYKGEQVGDGRGFLPADKVGCRKKFKPAFEQQSSQRLSIHQQPLRELGQQSVAQLMSSENESLGPRVDMAHAGGTGMRSRKGHMLSGAALSNLAASVAKSVPRPQAVLKPTVQQYDKLKHSMSVHHGHMPGTTVVQRKATGLW
jgi:hypothetical protein